MSSQAKLQRQPQQAPVSPTRNSVTPRQRGGVSSSTSSKMSRSSNAVVAHLSQRKSGSSSSGSKTSPGAHHHHHQQQYQHHPYSAIALSPCRHYAVTAGKDVLQLIRLRPTGLQTLKTVPAALYFQHQPVRNNTGASARSGSSNKMSLSEFAFGGASSKSGPTVGAAPTSNSILTTNVVITDVAWSRGASDNNTDNATIMNTEDTTSSDSMLQSSRIAAAGSNGVIVVWSAAVLLEGTAMAGAAGTSNVAAAAPEAVLSQHVRAVNRLAWHPGGNLLLSASQDATVLLWERRPVVEPNASAAVSAQQQQEQQQQQTRNKFGFFAGFNNSKNYAGGTNRFAFNNTNTNESSQASSFQWLCTATFAPKSEAVRDIQWSPNISTSNSSSDVFAVVTGSGSLIVYNRRVPSRAMVKLTAHSGDATCLDWHPVRPHVIATGGAGDRSVKIWDLAWELDQDDNGDARSNMERNSNTLTSRAESVGTNDSSGHESVAAAHYPQQQQHYNSGGSTGPSVMIGPTTMITVNSRTMSSTSSAAFMNVSRHKATPKNLRHVLSISASVTRLKWRPPARDTFAFGDSDDDEKDRHESMLAVATASVKGASAGGSGMLALWSYHRPYMPLSVVEGHKDGAVTDFEWLDTPLPPAPPSARHHEHETRLPGNHLHDTEAILYDNNSSSEHPDGADDRPVGIWQHVLSVGRDGRCLIQSFARGDRPISRVPPSCFAMANLSPFQKGYGSLQFFSVCQTVPSGADSDFWLTGLRRDSVTATALGVFRELPLDGSNVKKSVSKQKDSFDWKAGERLPESSPEIVFNVVDQGDLDEESNPVEEEDNEAMIVCPEVVHLSRFSSRYRFYRDDTYPTRVNLCLHNANAADSLRSRSLAHMWRMIAFMLESTELDGLPDTSSHEPQNVMQFVILPTMKALLEERADAGDVQTCVALCEVFEIIKPDQTVRIPDLEINLIREWYLSYIDLLRDMCLFSDATYLIRSCKDPYIGALNQQSTTIHESCPHCGKMLMNADGAVLDHDNTFARRACKSCRRRVGLCFLCHEPVKGLYVWCPGCGHGGHLSHALQWFGGLSGKGVREVCPTGCGHKCNLVKELSAFPRTDSMHETAYGEYCEPIRGYED